MYMWGSIANGTADDWSDIDVAAVMRDGDYEAVKAEMPAICGACLLYTSDAADDLLCVDLGGRRIIKKKK